MRFLYTLVSDAINIEASGLAQWFRKLELSDRGEQCDTPYITHDRFTSKPIVLEKQLYCAEVTMMSASRRVLLITLLEVVKIVSLLALSDFNCNEELLRSWFIS